MQDLEVPHFKVCLISMHFWGRGCRYTPDHIVKLITGCCLCCRESQALLSTDRLVSTHSATAASPASPTSPSAWVARITRLDHQAMCCSRYTCHVYPTAPVCVSADKHFCHLQDNMSQVTDGPKELAMCKLVDAFCTLCLPLEPFPFVH